MPTESTAAADFASGLRATTRIELSAELAADVEALLPLAICASAPKPSERIRAAGRDLVFVRGFASLVEHQPAESPLDEEGSFLCAVAGAVAGSIDRLLRRLDQETGLENDPGWSLEGLREVFLLRVESADVRRALGRFVALAHCESLAESAAPPLRPVRLSILGLAEEIEFLGCYLCDPRLPVPREIGATCRRIAGAVRSALEAPRPYPSCTSLRHHRPSEDLR